MALKAHHLDNAPFCTRMVAKRLVTVLFVSFCFAAETISQAAELHTNSKRAFEGDIQPVFSQLEENYGSDLTRTLIELGVLSSHERNGLLSLSSSSSPNSSLLSVPPLPLNHFPIWPNKRVNGIVEIPYFFADNFSGDRHQVEQEMKEVGSNSGVLQFVETTSATSSDEPKLCIRSDEKLIREKILSYYPSCWSYVGYQKKNGNIQDLNLGPGCQDISGLSTHELFHTLGLWHASSSYDRDDYVKVVWSNVGPGLEYDLQKRIVDDSLGAPYDYLSIMHNTEQDFSNGSIVMEAPVPGIGLLERGPSQGDYVRLRLLYQCESGPRHYSDYLTEPCTVDCKCWEGMEGCGGMDEACQGNLICDKDCCIVPTSRSWSFSCPSIVVVIVVAVVLAFASVLGIKQCRQRKGYESLS